jgi:hypothetical protein
MEIMIKNENYRAEVEKLWKNDTRMVNWTMKNVSAVVELSNGGFHEIWKPSIKTRFCFGYDANYSADDIERARAAAKRAYEDTEKFKNENLRSLRGKLAELKSDAIPIVYQNYNFTGFCKTKIYGVKLMSHAEYFDATKHGAEFSILPDEDREKLIKAYENEILKFEKRLNVYLKKYGLTKINVWTFMED